MGMSGPYAGRTRTYAGTLYSRVRRVKPTYYGSRQVGSRRHTGMGPLASRVACDFCNLHAMEQAIGPGQGEKESLKAGGRRPLYMGSSSCRAFKRARLRDASKAVADLKALSARQTEEVRGEQGRFYESIRKR
jgi:hypothetical protein